MGIFTRAISHRENSLKMVAGNFYIPKESELHPNGDDAHFISVEKQTIGVADGVGGWTKHGIDAGKYARQLMNNCMIAIVDEPKKVVDPLKIMERAYSKTCAQGSSTACIITLNGRCLHIANVGDSGFVLIRKGAKLFRSSIHQHSFNHPYQLGKAKKSDRPNSAQVFKVVAKPGDVIVAGTDGLFDNMFACEIEEVVKMGIEEGMEPEMVAWAIAEYAHNVSIDGEAPTPFTRASLKAGRKRCGGKVDDITVIVSYIL